MTVISLSYINVYVKIEIIQIVNGFLCRIKRVAPLCRTRDDVVYFVQSLKPAR